MSALRAATCGRIGWLACAALAFSLAAAPFGPAWAGETCRAAPEQFAAAYDYVLGTQAFSAHGQGSDSGALMRQAREIRAMGSNVLKISLGRNQAAKYGFGDAASGASSEIDYVKRSPELQRVLDLDFKYYHFWVQTFTASEWRDGVTKGEARAYYDETFKLTEWLLRRYAGTGKVFMIGNWEGDWLLNGGKDKDAVPSQQAIDGMIAWLNIRQKAIEDAKAAAGPHAGVEVYQYVEVNLVKRGMDGRPSVASSVLPATNVDLVSYSSYEAIKASKSPDIASIRAPLTVIVNYLEGQLKPKRGLPFDRRVFLGEFGYHADRRQQVTVEQQYLKSRHVMQVALELNLPFALIWQLYNNEFAPDGTSKEMALIEDDGSKRALYYLHQRYLSEMTAFVAQSCRSVGEPPSRDAFTRHALTVLNGLDFEKTQAIATNQGAVKP